MNGKVIHPFTALGCPTAGKWLWLADREFPGVAARERGDQLSDSRRLYDFGPRESARIHIVTSLHGVGAATWSEIC
jgi:hypothetical protein